MTVVKKLEWNEYNDEQGIPDRWDAEASSFGVFYSIEIQHDGYRVVFDHEAVGAVGVFGTLEAAKAAAQQDFEARILSAHEPSALDMGNPITLDIGKPITDKTVKMVLAEAIAQVWYQTRDCDVEEIDRIIAHLNRNGLLIVGIQRFKMMADAIQSAAAYLALSQPNSAEKLIADLDAALKTEVGNPATEPSAARELALAEAAQVAEDYVQYDVAAAIRALSSPDHADATHPSGGDRHGE